MWCTVSSHVSWRASRIGTVSRYAARITGGQVTVVVVKATNNFRRWTWWRHHRPAPPPLPTHRKPTMMIGESWGDLEATFRGYRAGPGDFVGKIVTFIPKHRLWLFCRLNTERIKVGQPVKHWELESVGLILPCSIQQLRSGAAVAALVPMNHLFGSARPKAGVRA